MWELTLPSQRLWQSREQDPWADYGPWRWVARLWEAYGLQNPGSYHLPPSPYSLLKLGVLLTLESKISNKGEGGGGQTVAALTSWVLETHGKNSSGSHRVNATIAHGSSGLWEALQFGSSTCSQMNLIPRYKGKAVPLLCTVMSKMFQVLFRHRRRHKSCPKQQGTSTSHDMKKGFSEFPMH